MTKASKYPSHSDYSGLHFFNETGFEIPLGPSECRKIISLIEQFEDCGFAFVEIAFVEPAEIIRINREHLGHNYVTDVVSFRYDDHSSNQAIEGTIYACGKQVADQAAAFDEPAANEFRRIVIHGLLHLTDYNDQSEAEKIEMRERENFYLQKLEV